MSADSAVQKATSRYIKLSDKNAIVRCSPQLSSMATSELDLL